MDKAEQAYKRLNLGEFTAEDGGKLAGLVLSESGVNRDSGEAFCKALSDTDLSELSGLVQEACTARDL